MPEQTYILIGCSVATIFCLIFMAGESARYHRSKVKYKAIDGLISAIILAICLGFLVGLIWPIALCILVPFYLTKLWTFLD